MTRAEIIQKVTEVLTPAGRSEVLFAAEAESIVIAAEVSGSTIENLEDGRQMQVCYNFGDYDLTIA